MITNADIFLHETNQPLIEKLKENKMMFALSRYEYDMTHPMIDNYGGSHDAYIFNSKYLNETMKHTQNYQNFPGIESQIIKTFCDNNNDFLNNISIKELGTGNVHLEEMDDVHLHKTELRNYGKWIGLHKCGDFDFHKKSCWWVPPIVL